MIIADYLPTAGRCHRVTPMGKTDVGPPPDADCGPIKLSTEARRRTDEFCQLGGVGNWLGPGVVCCDVDTDGMAEDFDRGSE